MGNKYSVNKHSESKIKINTIIAIRLTFSVIMFAVFAYMPFMTPTMCGYVLGVFGTHTQGMAVVESMLADEKRTTITLKDTLNETERVVYCAIGEVLNIDIPTKENYAFNGYWTEKPQNAMPNGARGEQYIDSQGKGIKEITSKTPTTLYINWVGVECKVKFYIKNSLKVTRTAYFGNTFGDCFEFPTNKELGLNDEMCYWYKEYKSENNTEKFFGEIQTERDVIDKLNNSGTLKLYGNVVNPNDVKTYTVTLEIEENVEILPPNKMGNWVYDGKKFIQEYLFIKGQASCTIGTYPEIERKGYKFLGWYNNGKEISDETSVTQNMKYTAKWEPAEYKVKLSINGSDNIIFSATYGEKLSDAPLTIPTPKEHYTFAGYYSETGEQYIDSQGNGIREWDIAENTTLVGKFVPIEYTITYDLNGGMQADENPPQYNIEDEAITLTAPTKTGYNFVGWITAENETPQKEITIPQGSYGDRTYIAVYELSSTEGLKINITCTNYNGQTIFVYIYDEQKQLITSIQMTTPQLTYVPENAGTKYYLQFKTTLPNKLTFTLPTNCTQTTLDSTTTIALPTPNSQNYDINFTATNIQIINTITV